MTKVVDLAKKYANFVFYIKSSRDFYTKKWIPEVKEKIINPLVLVDYFLESAVPLYFS